MRWLLLLALALTTGCAPEPEHVVHLPDGGCAVCRGRVYDKNAPGFERVDCKPLPGCPVPGGAR